MPATKPSLTISPGGDAGRQGAAGDVVGGGGVVVDDRVDRLLDELVPVGHSVQLLLKKSCRPLARRNRVSCATVCLRRAAAERRLGVAPKYTGRPTGKPRRGGQPPLAAASRTVASAAPAAGDAGRGARRPTRLDTMSRMRYYGAVIRPPSEASSLIVQVTYGCSNASCDFCSTYLDKPFAVRPPDEVADDITGLPDSIKAARAARVSRRRRRPRPVTPPARRHPRACCARELPALERVSCYANARTC